MVKQRHHWDSSGEDTSKEEEGDTYSDSNPSITVSTEAGHKKIADKYQDQYWYVTYSVILSADLGGQNTQKRRQNMRTLVDTLKPKPRLTKQLQVCKFYLFSLCLRSDQELLFHWILMTMMMLIILSIRYICRTNRYFLTKYTALSEGCYKKHSIWHLKLFFFCSFSHL